MIIGFEWQYKKRHESILMLLDPIGIGLVGGSVGRQIEGSFMRLLELEN